MTENSDPSLLLPTPTACKISTITAVGSVGSKVELHPLSQFLTSLQGRPLLHAGCSVRVSQSVKSTKRASKAQTKQALGRVREEIDEVQELLTSSSTMTKVHNFDNQITVIVTLDVDSVGTQTSMNMKIFKNGKVQITGVKRIEYGFLGIQKVVDVLKSVNKELNGTIVKEPEALCAKDYKIFLINSDFNLGFKIRRDRLFNLLRTSYDPVTSFEPCIYPGVKIKFMWNVHPASSPTGGCNCSAPCSGKGGGNGDGDCRKITIVIFQSGSVIITGAHTLEQIDMAYRFVVNDIAMNHMDVIKMPAAPPASIDVTTPTTKATEAS